MHITTSATSDTTFKGMFRSRIQRRSNHSLQIPSTFVNCSNRIQRKSNFHFIIRMDLINVNVA